MKKTFVAMSLLIANSALASELPDFLDVNDINNAAFKCLGDAPTYSKVDQKYVDLLWDETLTYLRAYASALTNGEKSHCLNSDEALFDSTEGRVRA